MQDARPLPPAAAHVSPARRAGDWPALTLVILTFACVIGATLAAWWRVAPRPPSAIERYFPHADGTAWSYTVSGETGEPLYQSRSAELMAGNEAAAQLPARLLARALALTAGGSPADDDDTMIGDAQRAETHLLRVARITDTSLAPSGAITTSVGLYLILPERVGLMALDGRSLDPPLPILDLALAPGETLTTRGTFDSLRPYTATLALEAREDVTTPASRFESCLRTRLVLQLDTADTTFVSWFCDGVGMARQESQQSGTPQPQTYALLGGSLPGLVASGELPAPLTPDATARPRGQGGYGAVPALPTGELAPLWHYREPGANVDVTTAPLPVGDLLIFGTANGGLVALERTSHTVRWRFQAGGAIVGTPVVEAGVVYFGANDRRLYALDLASGAFRWAFATRDAISASPEIAGGLVYVGSEDRTLYALAAQNGQVRWRFSAGDAIAASPRVVDGTLFFGADDGVLYALGAADGAPRWAFSAADAITAAPLVRDGVVYVGAHDGTLYALRADSSDSAGELLWSYDAEEPIEANLALDADSIYLATVDGSLRAVDARTGAERWRAGSGLAFDGAPLVAGERVLIAQNLLLRSFAARDGRAFEPIPLGDALTSYDVTASISGADGELFVGRASGVVQVVGDAAALPWASRPAWAAETLSTLLRDESDHLLTPPAISGERLAGISFSGLVYSVDLADGDARDHGWLAGEAPFLVPPAADARTLFVIDSAGVLTAFDLEAGAARWRATLDGRTRSAPALADGRVLVATSGEAGTTAYAFDATSGAELWRRRLAQSPTGAAYTLLHAGRFLVTAGTLHALDPASGEDVWAADPSLIAVQLAAEGDTVYSFAAGQEGWRLAAWDGASGVPRLNVAVDAPTFPNLAGGLAAGDGVVALLLADRTLLALDAADGAERWRLTLGAGTRGAPVITAGRLLVQDQRNHLLAYTATEGRLVGDFALIDDIGLSDSSAAQPLLHGDHIYVAFYNSLAALRLAEGTP